MRPHPELLATIAAPFLGTQQLQITPVMNLGIVNQVWTISGGGRKLIARLSQEDSIDEFAKESWCLSQAKELGIPGPHVLCMGEQDGCCYLLLSYVGMVNGTEYTDQLAIWKWLGSQAVKINSLRTKSFGDKLSNLTAETANGAWERYISYNIESLVANDPLIELSAYPHQKQPALKALWETAARITAPLGLCHGDLSPRNVVIDQAGSFHLIDWGSAHSHLVPHYDFFEALRLHAPDSQEVKAFAKGYGLSAEELTRIQPELKALMVLRAVDTVRWARDRAPEKLQDQIKKLQDTLLRFNI